MIIIRSPADISAAKMPHALSAYVTILFAGITQAIPDFDPDNSGHLVVVTPTDTDESLCKKLGFRYLDNVFEGVEFNIEFRCFHAVILANNQFTISVIVPCEAWLDPVIRARMEKEIA